MRVRLTILFTLAAVAAAAGMPYAGKWKQNMAKSDFGQTTVTYRKLPGGEWQTTSFGVTYKFKMDGKDYPDTMGGTVAWKAVDANSWELTSKVNGKVSATSLLKLSADGKTLTETDKTVKPGGGSLDNDATLRRVSGGPGLAGKWKTEKVGGSPEQIEISTSGANGVTFKDSEMQMTCDAKLDDKDYPCTGPMTAEGFTVAMKNMAPRSLHIDVKKDGKLFFTATYTVAADGKSMTETGGAVANNEKFKIAYDRM